MPTRIVTAAAVALGFVCPAFAETRISVGTTPSAETSSSSVALAKLGQVANGKVKRVALTTAADGTATLTFDVTTQSARPTEVRAMLDVVRGARITGMTVKVGKQTLFTSAHNPGDARAWYRGTVATRQDPALLERVGSTETGTELQLLVSPLTRWASAHVELTIEMPRQRDDFELTAPAFVSGETSLVALERPTAQPFPVVRIGCGGFSHHGDLDKAIIRRYMKLNLPRVKACYERELLKVNNDTLAGDVALHFMIAPSGKTTDISVDGSLASDAVKACIADDLKQWEFPAVKHGYSGVRINYPLTFRPSS